MKLENMSQDEIDQLKDKIVWIYNKHHSNGTFCIIYGKVKEFLHSYEIRRRGQKIGFVLGDKNSYEKVSGQVNYIWDDKNFFLSKSDLVDHFLSMNSVCVDIKLKNKLMLENETKI